MGRRGACLRGRAAVVKLDGGLACDHDGPRVLGAQALRYTYLVDADGHDPICAGRRHAQSPACAWLRFKTSRRTRPRQGVGQEAGCHRELGRVVGVNSPRTERGIARVLVRAIDPALVAIVIHSRDGVVGERHRLAFERVRRGHAEEFAQVLVPRDLLLLDVPRGACVLGEIEARSERVELGGRAHAAGSEGPGAREGKHGVAEGA